MHFQIGPSHLSLSALCSQTLPPLYPQCLWPGLTFGCARCAELHSAHNMSPTPFVCFVCKLGNHPSHRRHSWKQPGQRWICTRLAICWMLMGPGEEVRPAWVQSIVQPHTKQRFSLVCSATRVHWPIDWTLCAVILSARVTQAIFWQQRMQCWWLRVAALAPSWAQSHCWLSRYLARSGRHSHGLHTPYLSAHCAMACNNGWPSDVCHHAAGTNDRDKPRTSSSKRSPCKVQIIAATNQHFINTNAGQRQWQPGAPSHVSASKGTACLSLSTIVPLGDVQRIFQCHL